MSEIYESLSIPDDSDSDDKEDEERGASDSVSGGKSVIYAEGEADGVGDERSEDADERVNLDGR
jgi:hypothetical protein